MYTCVKQFRHQASFNDKTDSCLLTGLYICQKIKYMIFLSTKLFNIHFHTLEVVSDLTN